VIGAADLAQDRDLLERVAARLSQAAAWPGRWVGPPGARRGTGWP
jgi:hypothetical protein